METDRASGAFRGGGEVRCRSHAKVNLHLDVLNHRRDGFHNIETVFQTVDLWDELSFAPAPSGGIILICSDPGLPVDGRNLVVRAAELLNRARGTRHGARIHLEKNIPVAAGLAGGSGNAAAALLALNRLWGLGLGQAELAALALELGSDVPYCLTGGTAGATRRGEEIFALPPLVGWWFVLVHPPVAVSARDAYQHPLLERNTERPRAGRTRSFRSALRALADGDVPGMLFNRLEGPVFAMHPELARIKRDLLDAGCDAALMSGSGSTVFGLCGKREQAAEAGAALRRRTPSMGVNIAGAVGQGVVFL